MRERYGINVIMHRATDAPYIDLRVDDGDEIQFGQQTLKVIYTPGHTQDAMCLLFKDRIFTGDTLFDRRLRQDGSAGRQCRSATREPGKTQNARRPNPCISGS